MDLSLACQKNYLTRRESGLIGNREETGGRGAKFLATTGGISTAIGWRARDVP